MSLPPLSIPDIALPFAIPHMVHPFFVHFAIALPVVIILFELVNLATKRKSVGVMSFLLILLLVVAYVGAYLAGITDGKEAAKMLSPEAKEALGAHKQLGIYLVYGSLVVMLFKLISAAVNKFPARLVFLLILIGFTLMAFSEGKKGGELVYKYGANVQAAQPAAISASPAAESRKAPVSVPAEVQVEAAKKEIENGVNTVKEKADKAVKATVEKSKAAAEKVEETVKAGSEKAKETIQKVIKPSSEAPVNPQPVTPVETVPAG